MSCGAPPTKTTLVRAYVDVAAAADAARGCLEVVQCYVRDPPMRHVRRWRRLVAFSRVHLARPAERRTISLNLTAHAMALLDDESRWRVLPGEYIVTCGKSSADANALEARIQIA